MKLSEDVKFWEEWERGDDLERLDKTRKLVNIALGRYVRKNGVYSVTSILNGYFEDLKRYLEEKENEKRKGGSIS